ncbi:cytochrome P450 9e2-like [Chrysoperla carnea]|uniref:cytochrome P450 9e2-like n=1 Tax=Chrysoperla carnea TaxID=189513 RepID=UPI001D0779B4|nr:cytochrome P450 9e2-like [Chrysoperla carnea]
MLIIALVILTIIVACYWYLVAPLSHWEKRGIPYVKGYPIVGNFFWHAIKKTSIGDDLMTLYHAYPEKKCYGMFLFGRPAIFVRDLDLIKNVLIKNFDHFGDHSDSIFLNGINPVVDRNLFSLTGNDWRDMRTTLSPAFTGSKMRGMFQLMADAGENFVNYFINEAKKNGGKPLNVELKEIFTRLTNDVIATTAFGIKIDSLRDRNNDFYRMGGMVSNFSTWRWLLSNFLPHVARFFRIGLIPNEPIDYLRKIALETINIRERDNIYRPDMLQLLIEAKNGLLKQTDTNEEINKGFAAVEESKLVQTNKKIHLGEDDLAAQAFVFFLGGFETVSAGLCFAVYELALNPDIQQRLYEENEKILNENNGKLTYDVLNKMKYLDMIMSETLRKWTIAAFLERMCIKPYTVEVEKGKNITLEKGTVLFFPVWALHRNPEYYPNPEKFDPERFSDENKDKINPTTYLPFGTGPRNCIGSRFALMEAKMAVFYMVKYFEIIPNEKSMIPPKVTTKSVNTTLENGFHVALKLREHCDIK